MEIEVVTSVIASLTALFAVIVGPFINLKAQKNALLGPMRQSWINELRDTVAKFLGEISIPREYILASKDKPNEVIWACEENDRNKLIKITELHGKITMLTNPNEPEHIELVRLITIASEKYYKNVSTNDVQKNIVKHVQKVLKTEWNVVKE